MPRRQKERVRAAILTAAGEALAARRMQGATLPAIAAGAGTSVG